MTKENQDDWNKKMKKKVKCKQICLNNLECPWYAVIDGYCLMHYQSAKNKEKKK